ncbi:MAG: Holliday junction resolvase RuvX [Pseudomonadota bacterium]
MLSDFDTAALDLPPTGCLIGLDLGDKTIGLASCDPDRRLATPVTTIRRTKFTPDAEALIEVCNTRSAVGLVIGLPLNMDGTEGPRAQSTRAFARNLTRLTSLPMVFWDERMSTAAMERELIGLDTSRAKRARVIDESAAAYILQGAIDRLGFLKKD